MGWWFNNSSKTKFIEIDNNGFIPFMEQTLQCKRCGNFVQKEYGRWISKCDRCGTYISFFMPTPIQQAAALVEASVMFNIGAYGSGKTTISAYKFSSMLRRIPKARMICMAQTLQQLEKNAISELEKFFHPSEIKTKSKKYWELINGSTIEFWPSDDEDKLRSANVNFVWLVEAHTDKMHSIYKQAVSRIRNENGYVYKKDENGNLVYKKWANGKITPILMENMNMIIVEANPEDGSWTSRAVIDTHTVLYTSSVRGIDILKNQAKPKRSFDEFTQEQINSDYIGILNATVDNPTIPRDYLNNLRGTCATQEQFDRQLYCDITMKEGLVFRDIVEHPDKYFIDVQSTLDLAYNRNKVFIETFDPGGSNSANDPDAYTLWIFDKAARTLQGVDEFKLSGLNLAESCNKINAIRRKWGWTPERFHGFYCDNALAKASKADRRHSLLSDYEIRLGVRITPCNDKGIAKSILQVQQWLENGALRFSKNQEELRKELFSYAKVKSHRYDKTTGTVVEYLSYSEKNNHLIDALRYGIIQLEQEGFIQDQHNVDYLTSGKLFGEQQAQHNIDLTDLPTKIFRNAFEETLNAHNKITKKL